MTFDWNEAKKYIPFDVQNILQATGDAGKYKEIIESLYTGSIAHQENGRVGFIADSFRLSDGMKDSLKSAKGSYAISSIVAESIIQDSVRSGIFSEDLDNYSSDKRDEFLDENKQFLITSDSLSESRFELLENIDQAEKIEHIFRGGWSNESAGGQFAQGDSPSSRASDLILASRNNRNIKAILDLIGNFVRIYSGIKNTLPGVNPEIPQGYSFSNDLNRVVPSEMVLLADEITSTMFEIAMIEGNLLCQEYISREEKGSGDIHVFLDCSYSMNVNFYANLNRSDLAAALCGAFFVIFKNEQSKLRRVRKFICHFFNDDTRTIDLTNLSISQGVNTIITNSSPSGSTNPAPGIMRLIKDRKSVKDDHRSDIMMITDGIFSVSAETTGEILSGKSDGTLHWFSLLLEIDPTDFISDVSNFIFTKDKIAKIMTSKETQASLVKEMLAATKR